MQNFGAENIIMNYAKSTTFNTAVYKENSTERNTIGQLQGSGAFLKRFTLQIYSEMLLGSFQLMPVCPNYF